jgi:ankyrin repeat protein
VAKKLNLAIFLIGSVALAGDASLLEAIKDGNLQAVKERIAAHFDVNEPLRNGSTPLAWAAYEDNEALVDLLLAAKAKAATVDEYGETPLSLACANGNPRITAKLLKAGADPNVARWNGESPLMIAARSGNPEVLRLLLEHGAKVDAVESRKGQDALMWAAAEGHAEAVEVLLKAGAKPNTLSKGGFSPLIFAATNGDLKTTTSLLAAGADVNYSVPAGMNALLVAMAGRKPKVAELLIAKGADPTAKDRTGASLLHSAAQLGDVEMMKSLVAKGLDVNAKTAKSQGGRGGGGARNAGPGEQTPLLLAAKGNHVEMMHELVKAGADPKLTAQDGTNVLIAAAGSGHIEAVKYAYELAPDIAAVTERGQTAVHAALTGTIQVSTPEDICAVIEFLAGKGADLKASDATGRKPIALAGPVDGAVDLLKKLMEAPNR